MKICIDGVTRDMTPEEEAKYFPPEPEPSDDATEQDYQNALKQMGVNFDENA